MNARQQVETLLALINDAAYSALDEYEKHGQETPILDSIVPHPLDSRPDTVALKKIIRKLEGACDHLCSTLAPPAHTVVNRAQDNYWAALSVATARRFTDILEGHPEGVHARDIAAATNIDEGKVITILRLLASRHCYKEVSMNTFANNRLSMQIHSKLDMASWIDLLSSDGQQAALNLRDALTNPEYAFGKDATRSAYMFGLKEKSGVQGATFYEITQSDPEKRTIMGKSMVAMNSIMGTAAVVSVFPWSKYHTVCDLGSGVGSFSWSLLDKHSNLKVTLFDLPKTVELAEKTWMQDHPEHIRAKTVAFVGGSFVENITVHNSDIYYFRHVIQDWSDSIAVNILRNVRRAMGPTSRLLIHEIIMKPLHRDASGSATGLGTTDANDDAEQPLLPGFGAGQIRMYNQDMTEMLVFNAKQRTVQEFLKLCKEAELKLEKDWDLGETHVLEFVPV